MAREIPDPQFEDYWKRVHEIIQKHFDREEFVADIRRTLVNLDRQGFDKLVEDAFTNVRTDVAKMEQDWPGPEPLKPSTRGGFLAGSFQYDSAVFGRWLRFRFKETDSPHYASTIDPFRQKDNSLYSPLEEEYIETLIEEAPREDNLLFNQYLNKPFCVQFGGSKTSYFHVSDQAWADLRKIVLSSEITVRELILSRPTDPHKVLEKKQSVIDLLLQFDDALRREYFDGQGQQWLGEPIQVSQSVITGPATLSFDGDWAKRLRLFIFTYFYTIMQRGAVAASPYTIW